MPSGDAQAGEHKAPGATGLQLSEQGLHALKRRAAGQLSSLAAPSFKYGPLRLTALMGKVVAALSLKAVRYRLSPSLHKKRENNKSDARVGGGSYNAKLFWFL